VVVALTVAFDFRRTLLRGALMVTAVAAVAVAINLPYLLKLREDPRRPATAFQSPQLATLWESFVQPARVLTSHKVEYLFSDGWARFTAEAPLALTATAATGLTLSLLMLLAWAGLVLALFDEEQRWRRIGLLAVLQWLAFPLFFSCLTLPTQAHYAWPTMWAPVFGVVALLRFLLARAPRLGVGATGLVLSLSLYHFSFVALWAGYTHREGGVRTVPLNSTIGELTRVVRELCARPEPAAFLINATAVFPKALLYVHSTEKTCTGRTLGFCYPGGCPADSPQSVTLSLRYARPTGAGLALGPR
jgi:hypothetical protein